MTIASNIVVEWLRSLHLGQYSESFIDNGYDDLEICKQIGDPDLDAIGVFNQTHRSRLLQSVKTLREEGAASVYFTLEETNDCLCDNVSSKSSRTSSERPTSEKEAQRASPTASSSSGGQELTKFADEYEEGKAELVRIPRMQLRMLLQEKLRHDGIRLACQPYTTPICERAVHAIEPCSVPASNNDEGYGQKRICPSCISKTNAPRLIEAHAQENWRNKVEKYDKRQSQGRYLQETYATNEFHLTDAITTIPIIKSGSDRKLRGITQGEGKFDVIKTCAFDSLFQMLLTVAVDSMSFVDNVIRGHGSSNPFYALIDKTRVKGITTATYRARVDILGAHFQKTGHPEVGCFVIHCETTVAHLARKIFKDVPCFIETTSCTGSCKPKDTAFALLTINLDALIDDDYNSRIMEDISLPSARVCTKEGCEGRLSSRLKLSGGFVLLEVAETENAHSVELHRLPNVLKLPIMSEALKLRGIIHFRAPPMQRRSENEPADEGEQGYLEGLASRYADLFRTHYGDVLEPLEELRRRETNASPRMPNTQLTTSHSQPIYVPGKYSPSSCLSDKEEDEIYGFGYGVFGRQMLQQRQQKLALATQNTQLATPAGIQQQQQQQQQQTYQSCLSPRSAYFYEFPPNEQGQNTSKKKTTFSRLLRGLKTHRKEKQQGQTQGSPRHGRARIGVPQRVDTPDSVLQSGLGMGPDMGHTILRSMVDPRDYDRLRYLQMNGGQPNSFEETIHRLKVQDALRKKERFHKEHEEILRDIRQGLMQLGRDGRGQLPGDDTYMYDEDARCGGVAGGAMIAGGPGPQHWYDEPPYESDPEDFLMGASGAPVPTATIQNGRVCFTLNLRPENRGEGVISLRTAGDISLPRDRSRKLGMSTMRGLIVPQGHNNPPTIIPLTHSRASRESGDYASSDVQSRSSGEEGLSPSQSSDYEDQEELENRHTPAIHTSEASALLESADGRVGIAGRARNLRHDVQRKITRLREDRASSEAFPCSASSVESLPSGSGSSTQALVRAGSNHSSISCEERDPVSPTAVGPVLCRAKAIDDCTPSPYDKDALKFKKGDVIDVVQMNRSGLWKGVVHNRIGHFKFINVEILNERVPRRGEPERTKWGQRYRQRPGSVQELLQRMNLQEHIPVFVLNGYEDLELFRELEPADLDFLRIHQPEHRAKILTAVQLLHELQSGSEGDLASSSEGDEISRLAMTSGQTSGHCSPFSRRQFPRDSGCYDAHKNSTRRTLSPEHASKLLRENNLDVTMPLKCPTSIEAATMAELKDDFHRNIPINVGNNSIRDCQQLFEKSSQHLQRGNPTSNVRFIGKRGNFGETVVIGDETNSHKILPISAKYAIGGCSDLGIVCETTGISTAGGLGQRGCLSEKSSDSGVSSSSLSSAPTPRDKGLTGTSCHVVAATATTVNVNTTAANVTNAAAAAAATGVADSPTKNFGNFTRGSPTSQASASKSNNETGAYQ